MWMLLSKPNQTRQNQKQKLKPLEILLRSVERRADTGGTHIASCTWDILNAVRPLEIRLTEGQLIMFPSYVFHEVAPYYGRDTRITVATNCWFA